MCCDTSVMDAGCCFCRPGSGVVVFSAPSIAGPWTRQGHDINCQTDSIDVCGKYGAVVTPANLTIAAQGIGMSVIHTATGPVHLWSGERWLSAPFNNPTCQDECGPCNEPPQYIKGDGFAYWCGSACVWHG